MDLGAFSISIPVTDLDRSLTFYRALGFEVVGGEAEAGYQILRNGETTIGLFAFEGMEFEVPMLTFNPGLQQDMSSPSEFTDIREIRRRLLDASIAIEEDLDPEATGPAHLGLRDPDGHPILIDQFRNAPGTETG